MQIFLFVWMDLLFCLLTSILSDDKMEFSALELSNNIIEGELSLLAFSQRELNLQGKKIITLNKFRKFCHIWPQLTNSSDLNSASADQLGPQVAL